MNNYKTIKQIETYIYIHLSNMYCLVSCYEICSVLKKKKKTCFYVFPYFLRKLMNFNIYANCYRIILFLDNTTHFYIVYNYKRAFLKTFGYPF